MKNLRFWLLLVTLCGGMTMLDAAADDDDYEHEDDYEEDHRRARDAFERGEIMSLEQLLESVVPTIPGEIVGIEFEKEDGVWVYEFYVIDKTGNLLEVMIDARTGDVLKTESR